MNLEGAVYAEKNGRRVGTRITLSRVSGYSGEYLTMELPIVFDSTVYWAAQGAKKALNILSENTGDNRSAQWFIERYDAIMEDDI